MNIVFSSNSDYAKYLYVALTSLFETNLKNDLQLYVLTSDFNVQDEQMLVGLADKYNKELSIIYLDKDFLGKFKTNARISKEAYYRLYIPWLLPQHRKAIYLDVDMIVNKDLSDFYDIDITKYALAACHDYTCEELISNGRKGFRNTLGDNNFFISAPLLMNLEWFRNNLSYKDYERAVEELGDNFIFHDMDILNYLLYDKVLYIDDIYSIMPCYTGEFPILKKKAFEYYDYSRTKKDAFLIHYAGYNPWRAGIVTEHYKMWWSYAKKVLFLRK